MVRLGGVLFGLEPKSEGYEADAAWAKGFERQWVCGRCVEFDRAIRATGYDIVLSRRPKQTALDWAKAPRGVYALIHRAFAKVLCSESNHDLLMGRVFVSGGREVEDYATYLGRRPIPIRGSPKSLRQPCPECGSFIYTPAYPGWCVLVSDLRSLDVYESHGSLLVTEQIMRRIDRKRWKGIQICEIPIVAEPQDGIIDFPDNWYYRGPPQ